MKANIFVFTSTNCSHCHHTMELVNKLNREDVNVQEVSTSTEEGLKLARENGITSVPVTFISCEESKEVIGLRGTPSFDELNNAIDTCLGKK